MTSLSICIGCGKEFEKGEGWLSLIEAGAKIIQSGSFETLNLCQKCYYYEKGEKEGANFQYTDALQSLRTAAKEGSDKAADRLLNLEREIDSLIEAGIRILPDVSNIESEDEMRAAVVCFMQFHKLAESTGNERLKLMTNGKIQILQGKLL